MNTQDYTGFFKEVEEYAKEHPSKPGLPPCGRCSCHSMHEVYQALYGNCDHVALRSDK